MSKTTTLILTTLTTLFIVTPLAFASPYKATAIKRTGESAAIALAYGKSSAHKMAPIKQTPQTQYAYAVSKIAPLPGTHALKPNRLGKIANLTSQDHGGWSSVQGTLAGPDGQPLDLTIEVDSWGSGEIYLETDSGPIYEATLNQDRMEIVSQEEDGAVTEAWLRPAGDLLDFLDQKDRYASTTTGPDRLEGIANHDTARAAVEEVARRVGGAFAELADRLDAAEAVYANWKDASMPDREMVRYVTTPAPIEPNEPPVSSCTYPDTGTATTVEQTLDIAGFADLTVSAGKVHVTAFCEDRAGCLEPDSKVTFNKITNGADNGSNGCPQNDTELGAEEFKVAILDFDAYAKVGRACAMNYDGADYATGFSAELTVKGAVEASIRGVDAKPEGVGGSTLIQGTAVVCYESDSFFDDYQDVLLSGSTHAKLDKGR